MSSCNTVKPLISVTASGAEEKAVISVIFQFMWMMFSVMRSAQR